MDGFFSFSATVGQKQCVRGSPGWTIEVPVFLCGRSCSRLVVPVSCVLHSLPHLSEVGLTTFTTVVVQRLEASTGSFTFYIKCRDDGFQHDSFGVPHQSCTDDLHRARTKVLRVSFTKDSSASMSSVSHQVAFR